MTTSTAGLSLPYVYAPKILGLGAALPAIGCIIVATRFYVRRIQKTAVSIDDWLILGGLMMVIGMGACVIAGAKKGAMGYPTPPPPPLTPAEMETYVEPAVKTIQQIEFPFQIMMLVSYGLIKLSIIYFYRRLFVVGKSGTFNIITKLAVVVVGLWTIAFLCLFVFNCGSNVGAHWGSLLDISTSCKFSFTAEEGMAASDLILDVFVFFLPFPMIWKLHMTTVRKAAVSAIFKIGAAAIAASIVRLVIYVEILTKADDAVIDEDLGITLLHYWSLLEAGLALIAACMPSLSVPFAKRSLSSVINSVRSALSLQSLRSQNSRRSQHTVHMNKTNMKRYEEIQDDKSTASHAHMVPKDNVGVESFVMGDLERGQGGNFREGEIHVEDVISQEQNVA